MDVKIKKELNNFNLSLRIEEKDKESLDRLLKFVLNNQIKINETLLDEINKFICFLKEPSNYNNLTYREYKNEKIRIISSIELETTKIFNYYYQNYFFNKRNLKEEKLFLSNLSSISKDIINSDKHEVKNAYYLKELLSQLNSFLSRYEKKIKAFIDDIDKYLKKSFNIKLSKKSEFRDLELDNLEFIFYKEEDTIIKDWIVLNIKNEILNLKERSEYNLNVDLNNNLKTILEQIFNTEKFLKNIKENSPYFILLKESSVLKKYLKQKNRVLKLISLYDYSSLLERSLKQLSLEKKISYKKDQNFEKSCELFFKRKKKCMNSKFFTADNKAFLFDDSGYINHYYIENDDQENNPKLLKLNENLLNQKGFLSSIKYQTYFTIEKNDNMFSILCVHEYKFKNKNLIKKYFL